MSAATDAFVSQNRSRLLEELKQFVRIPSISTLPENRPEVDRAANFVAGALRQAGMENVELIPTDGYPLVYGDWLHAPGKPTVLCYGHYDVQPADPLELWTSPPFEPQLVDGPRGKRFVARGAVDDKGQTTMFLEALRAWHEAGGGIPAKLTGLIEGEEEVGSRNLEPFLIANKA